MNVRARPTSQRLAARLSAIGMLMLFSTAACAPKPAPTGVPQPAPTGAPLSTPTASRAVTAPPATPTLAAPAGGAYTKALEAAQKELATRLGSPVADIHLVSVEPVEWPDTSLGCPKPGMAYAQVITPGFRLILGAGQATYEFHADYAGHVTTCK